MIMIILGITLIIISFMFSLDDDNSNLLIWFICFWGSILLFVGILLKSPTAMELHAGKAVIKYEVIDGVKVDSIVVFKKKYETR